MSVTTKNRTYADGSKFGDPGGMDRFAAGIKLPAQPTPTAAVRAQKEEMRAAGFRSGMETAEKLGLSYSQFVALVAAGTIPLHGVEHNGTTFFRKDDVKAYRKSVGR
jgi:hypothetical protein